MGYNSWMRRRNREVSLPTLQIAESELESIIKGEALEFSALPNTIQANASLSYARWLANLTHHDATQSERASHILLDHQTKRLLYPPNPNIGNRDQAKPFPLKKPKRFTSICRVHSHIDAKCFSSQDWMSLCIDLASSTRFAELLGAQENTFLLLRSQDSQLLPSAQGPKMMTNYKKNEAAQINRDFYQYIKSRLENYSPPDHIDSRAMTQTKTDDRDQIELCATLSSTLYLNAYFADLLKFGLYINTEGNTFYRITTSNILPVINHFIEGCLPHLKPHN